MVAHLFRSRAALEVEIWMLRQQIDVLRRTAPKKQTFSAIDRLIFVCLYRLLPGVRDALAIVRPETVVKWHRAGFDASTFSGHSLRAGFLTSAAGKGASIFKMMDVSRHKSVDTLRGYVRDADLFKDYAGAGLL